MYVFVVLVNHPPQVLNILLDLFGVFHHFSQVIFLLLLQSLVKLVIVVVLALFPGASTHQLLFIFSPRIIFTS